MPSTAVLNTCLYGSGSNLISCKVQIFTWWPVSYLSGKSAHSPGFSDASTVVNVAVKLAIHVFSPITASVLSFKCTNGSAQYVTYIKGLLRRKCSFSIDHKGAIMPESRGRYRDSDSDGEKFCKLFIGGLNYTTNEEAMKEYFEPWGEVVDCVVMRDPNTKKSRGFGFITYKTEEQVDEAQRNRPHNIDNKEVETKRAMPRNETDSQATVKKLFVGGIKEDTGEEEIREYFSAKGKIETIDMITDKGTGKKRGFCFITFEDYDTVDKLVLKKYLDFKGKRVEVKKALSRAEMNHNKQINMGPMGGPMGPGPMGPGPMGPGPHMGGPMGPGPHMGPPGPPGAGGDWHNSPGNYGYGGGGNFNGGYHQGPGNWGGRGGHPGYGGYGHQGNYGGGHGGYGNQHGGYGGGGGGYGQGGWNQGYEGFGGGYGGGSGYGGGYRR